MLRSVISVILPLPLATAADRLTSALRPSPSSRISCAPLVVSVWFTSTPTFPRATKCEPKIEAEFSIEIVPSASRIVAPNETLLSSVMPSTVIDPAVSSSNDVREKRPSSASLILSPPATGVAPSPIPVPSPSVTKPLAPLIAPRTTKSSVVKLTSPNEVIEAMFRVFASARLTPVSAWATETLPWKSFATLSSITPWSPASSAVVAVIVN